MISQPLGIKRRVYSDTNRDSIIFAMKFKVSTQKLQKLLIAKEGIYHVVEMYNFDIVP